MSFSLQLRAQDNLVLHFDFSSVSGTSVQDTVSGITAKLINSAQVEQMGKYPVLNLGSNNGYLDMTSEAGRIIQQLNDFSISVYYRVNKNASLSGNGYFLWAFSTSSACSSNAGTYTAYRLNAQRYATSPGGYSNEVGGDLASASAQEEWIHVVFTQSGITGTLYVNGEKKKSTTGMPKLSSTFTTAPAYNWIGRAPFNGDNYLKNTLVADFRVYSEALTTESIVKLAALTESLDYEYRYGTPGDFTKLKAAVESANAFIAAEDITQYPANAVAEFMDAIHVAESVIQEGKINQELIDSYTTAISTAKNKFTKTKGFLFDISDVVEGYQTYRGFKHPGGLHTQADFDRIKQQLADGNEKVTAAYNILKEAAYSQANCATYPAETIVRGGSGENYINAARGATIAYQNALRWKIDGTKAHADNAVKVLMAWCNTTKAISGTSDQCLAYGIYGYEFAQAAELMRDYEGWSRDDFHKFQQWMLNVWYPGCIGFLRNRNGTWENAGKWWQAPGHYWSNWGLCNALAVISIGVLCDDVFIYNQGMSFIKYDQVGTFKDPRTANPILNDGLTEFWGNLVVTTSESELETGAYGKLGQMNESGRDTGHAAMALGLAIDIAHQGWNQGDDLFSYMDHRIAAGIEYVAAQTQSVEGLPWTNYSYGTNGIYYTDSRCWTMTGPALGAQMRPYWGTVIGHYEGVKGVKMPFSEMAYEAMGIDNGGMGGTSGGYDHLGYSVLMNTRDEQLAPADRIPTELTPQILIDDKIIEHNELGGLVNTYQTTDVSKRALAKGTVITLSPCLPQGTTDTGNWRWETGETTREITITANESRIWRVAYTNEHGVESELCFAIAVMGDCHESQLTTTIATGGKTVTGTSIQVFYGSEVTLSVWDNMGYGNWQWDNGQTTASITIPQITTTRDVRCYLQNQGGRKSVVTFHLDVVSVRPDILLNGKCLENTTTVVVSAGDSVVLSPNVPSTRAYGTWQWSDDSAEQTLTVAAADSSLTRTVQYTIDGKTSAITYNIYVKEAADRLVDVGNYRIRHRATDTYLTNHGDSVCFVPANGASDQIWYIDRSKLARYNLCSLADSMLMKADGGMYKVRTRPHRIAFAAGTDYCAFYNANNQYWYLDTDGRLVLCQKTTLDDFPFELLPVTSLRGDIDGDGAVTIQDVTCLIHLYLENASITEQLDADMDGDGLISVDDITALINLYLEKKRGIDVCLL
ncbi:MAG: alginate lyase family protein [Bacteroidaceae bacterium]|nr:alginate lyase family protein [Bacteroidaceae bacterium]